MNVETFIWQTIEDVIVKFSLFIPIIQTSPGAHSASCTVSTEQGVQGVALTTPPRLSWQVIGRTLLPFQ
jgi:hypothetical protein